jgi:hypothetical protein
MKLINDENDLKMRIFSLELSKKDFFFKKKEEKKEKPI